MNQKGYPTRHPFWLKPILVIQQAGLFANKPASFNTEFIDSVGTVA
ncbi:hypothetical protein ACO9S2_14025 [Nitrospira sp. NS4]